MENDENSDNKKIKIKVMKGLRSGNLIDVEILPSATLEELKKVLSEKIKIDEELILFIAGKPNDNIDESGTTVRQALKDNETSSVAYIRFITLV